jgi:putative transposase
LRLYDIKNKNKKPSNRFFRLSVWYNIITRIDMVETPRRGVSTVHNKIMPEKFKNKYRVGSTRLPGYDYSQNGLYFVTICTKDKECFFGEIVDGERVLSEVGKIAQQFWQETPLHFPHVNIDEFSIMPNHVHGIVEILPGAATCRDAINRVSTGGITGKHNPKKNPRSLSKIIRWYKGRCSFEINRTNTYFHWQSRFYDHIIRDDASLDKIREYICTNPAMWQRDRNNDADDMPTW